MGLRYRSASGRAFLLIAVHLACAAFSQTPTDTPEPNEAAEWNAEWEDRALEPLIRKPDSVREEPRFRAPFAGRFAPAPNSGPALFRRPYVREYGKPRILWRTRAVLPDPGNAGRWRRAGTYGRILASDGGAWDGGLIIERDRGEPGIVDYVGGALGYRSPDRRTDVVFGHIRAHAGVGLIVSGPTTFWIDPDGFRARALSLRGTLAATESGELFGVAGRVRRGAWEALFLLARPRWDATLSRDGVVTALRTDGIHVTDGERLAEKRLAETYAFGHVGWLPADWLSVGVNAARSEFSLPVRLSLAAEEPRDAQTLAGCDFQLARAPFAVHGEAVRDNRGPVGLAGSGEYDLLPLTLIAGGWSYDPDLTLPHGVGWSFRGEPTDERAAFVGIRWRAGQLSVKTIAARYAQNRASRSDSLPRSGVWEEIRVERRLREHVVLKGRWKRRTTTRPAQGTSGEARRQEWRAELLWKRAGWAVRPRADWVRARPNGSGALIALRVSRGGAGRLVGDVQCAAVRSTTGDAALYLYEVRAPGYGAIRMMTGTGFVCFGRIGGRFGGLDCSLAGSGVVRRGRRRSIVLTAQIEYGLP